MRAFLLIITLLIILTSISCTKELGREVSDPLTPKEYSQVPGRYQNGIDIFHTCRVDLDSPRDEPILLWSNWPDVSLDSTDIMVDGDGGVWCPDGKWGEKSTTKIVRYTPDGEIEWEREILPENQAEYELPVDPNTPYEAFISESLVAPMIACMDAVIIYAGRFENHEVYPGHGEPKETFTRDYAFLECMGTEGETRWRTDMASFVKEKSFAWMGPDNTVIMPSSKTSFNVYSIADGELVRTVNVPGWSNIYSSGPLPLDDGGWIMQGFNVDDYTEDFPPYIARIDSNGLTRWIKEFPDITLIYPVTLCDSGILVHGNENGLYGLDITDGSELWHMYAGNSFACGETTDGKIISCGWNAEGKAMADFRLRSITENGSENWSEVLPGLIDGVNDIIIYRDGAILIGYPYGISLLEPDGSIRWTLDMWDFRIPVDESISAWSLNPVPGDGIVAMGFNTKVFGNAIFSLGPSED